MNKRFITSIISIVIAITMLVSVPVFAKSTAEVPSITIEANKDSAFRGEEISYAIYLQQPDTITCFGFNIVIPTGLTLVDESIVLNEKAAQLFGETFVYTSPSETADSSKALPLLSWYSLNGEDFTNKSKLELMTFKCTVDEDAELDNLYGVELAEVVMAAGSTQNYADITDTVDVIAHFLYTTSKLPFVPNPNKPSSGSQNQGTDTPSTNVPDNEGTNPVTPGTSNSPYSDVASNAYYYAPVLWAAESGVTTGTSATTFSPDMNCTRGQTVTFLWRAAGSPKAENAANPFTDVKKGDYFYDAVLWAVEKGITTGISATEFAPNAMVNRGQTVTFIWRLAGKTTVSAENIFTDVANDSYFKDAVLWAAAKGITTGTSATTFQPDSGCTRGQIVTFIYRYFN